MNIDFGIVTKYHREKGFGFVTHTFRAGSQKEIFFHIKNIKKTHSNLAKKLDSEESNDIIFFWYETVPTDKGEQVRSALQSFDIQKKAANSLQYFIEKITTIWRNINQPMPVWIHDVTVDLVGVSRTDELSLERQNLEIKKNELEDKRRKEQEAQKEEQRKWQEERMDLLKAKLQESFEKNTLQEETEEKEFKQLVEEMKSKGFTHSKQVSNYIVKNRLGEKYKHISGIVRMEQAGTSWNFNGGFPPKIYARLCNELGLYSQGTNARAVGFTSFKDL